MMTGAADRVRQSPRALRPLSLVLLFALVLGSLEPAPAASPAAPAPVTSAPAAPSAAPPTSEATPPLNPPVSLKVGSLRLVGEAGLTDALGKGHLREERLNVDLVPPARRTSRRRRWSPASCSSAR